MRKPTADKAFLEHAGQVRVLGKAGQQKLKSARVAIVGVGRIGSTAALGLVAAGIGGIDCIDPQAVEREQLGPWWFASQADISRAKVDVLAQLLACCCGRVVVNPIQAAAEQPQAQQTLAAANLIVCAANTISARLATEQAAIKAGKPVIQAAAFDHCRQMGGLLHVHQPHRPDLSCYGCLLSGSGRKRARNDGLMTTVTAILGGLAAHLACVLLTGCPAEGLTKHNLFHFDCAHGTLEALTLHLRIPAMPIANSNLMAIRIPIDADHHRSEATLDCTYHR